MGANNIQRRSTKRREGNARPHRSQPGAQPRKLHGLVINQPLGRSHELVLTTRAIIEHRLPVRCVYRYLDGGRSFTDDETPMDLDQLGMVCAHHLFDHDPTLRDVAKLQPGQLVERQAVGAPWTRGVVPSEELK